MAKLVASKPALAPPTERQLTELKVRLQQCIFIEHAAALSGIPKRVLSEWILQGRAGHPDFAAFVDMLDEQLAELSSTLVTPIVEAAKSGNLQASMWLFNQRIRPHEERSLKKQFEVEDRLEESQRVIEAHADVAEADELAAKIMEQLTAGTLAEKH